MNQNGGIHKGGFAVLCHRNGGSESPGILKHQDEFLRGDHPATLFRGSIATPSLEAAVLNAKYVNSNPLDRIARDFQANGLNLSKQTMSNWTVDSGEIPPAGL